MDKKKLIMFRWYPGRLVNMCVFGMHWALTPNALERGQQRQRSSSKKWDFLMRLYAQSDEIQLEWFFMQQRNENKVLFYLPCRIKIREINELQRDGGGGDEATEKELKLNSLHKKNREMLCWGFENYIWARRTFVQCAASDTITLSAGPKHPTEFFISFSTLDRGIFLH